MSPEPAKNQQEMIAVAAYYRAERRGFQEGDPVADWLEAEVEIDQMFPVEPGQGMSAKQSLQQKLEAQLEEWDEKLKEVKSKTKESTAKTRAEVEKQLHSVAAKRAVAEEKLAELRKRSEYAWEDLRDGTVKAWGDMKEALDHVVARFR